MATVTYRILTVPELRDSLKGTSLSRIGGAFCDVIGRDVADRTLWHDIALWCLTKIAGRTLAAERTADSVQKRP